MNSVKTLREILKYSTPIFLKRLRMCRPICGIFRITTLFTHSVWLICSKDCLLITIINPEFSNRWVKNELFSLELDWGFYRWHGYAEIPKKTAPGTNTELVYTNTFIIWVYMIKTSTEYSLLWNCIYQTSIDKFCKQIIFQTVYHGERLRAFISSLTLYGHVA